MALQEPPEILPKEVGDLAGKGSDYVARRGGNALRKGRDYLINKLSTAKDRR